MKRPLIFMDGEFTKLTTKGVKFVSMAFILENGKELYLEIQRFTNDVGEWVENNVMPHMECIAIPEKEVKENIIEFLKENDVYFPNIEDSQKRPVLVADVNQFDWNGICDLFGVWDIPFFYIPIDFSTVLFTKGIDIDTNRLELAANNGIDTSKFKQHNALSDVRVLKLLWDLLNTEEIKYDSSKDTLAHIEKVGFFINTIIDDLKERIKNHDKTKLSELEKPYFDKYTPKLKDCTYGSEEYAKYLNELKIALNHHYKENKHHPEHYENGVKGMDLVDILEMLCDWKAATLRHNDGDILKSIEINQERFNYSDELKQILKNTIERYF